MRRFCLTSLVVALLAGMAHAAPPTKDNLIGEWTITKTVNGKKSDKQDTIVFRADGTYTWVLMGFPREGKFEIKDNVLHLHVGNDGALLWEKLDVTGDKATRDVGIVKEDWTRTKKG